MNFQEVQSMLSKAFRGKNRVTKLIFSWLTASVAYCLFFLVYDRLHELIEIRIFSTKLFKN